MKALILQVSLCSTVEWFATFALLRYKEYLHQFRFAQFANKALSSTYFAILALLELCKIICFPSLCSGTKYISTARFARCANKVSFRFNFYGLANFVYMLPFTTRWIKKYILQWYVKVSLVVKFIQSIILNAYMQEAKKTKKNYLGTTKVFVF